ncbi:MAG: hypothetical protein MUF18_12520 [Fimbriiglobus sp.]|nr:hypothetical protein [Fimbriiglobus sp.]
MFLVNLGGEGEVQGALNQQGPWVLGPGWVSSQTGRTLAELYADGHRFLICPNNVIALPDACVDEVVTNSVPIDVNTWLGPGVQSSEIRRILKVGGKWYHDGNIRWTKP